MRGFGCVPSFGTDLPSVISSVAARPVIKIGDTWAASLILPGTIPGCRLNSCLTASPW